MGRRIRSRRAFTTSGAEVIAIGAEPNGLNINAKVGATAPGALSQAVIDNAADLGVALDGDADRLIMVDAVGKVHDGDQLLLAVVRSRLRQGAVAGVVGTLMTRLLEHALAALGVPFSRAPSATVTCSKCCARKAGCTAAKNRPHPLSRQAHPTGDGIVSALQVLNALREEGAI